MRTVCVGLYLTVATGMACAARQPAPSSTSPQQSQKEPVAQAALLPPHRRDKAVPPPAVLDADAVAADLQLVHQVLDTAYSAKRFVPPERWQAMTQALDRVHGPLGAQAFCNAVDDALWELPDAHVGASQEAQRGRCGTRRKSERRTPSVGPNVAAGQQAPWVLQWRSAGTKRVAVLAITAFPASTSPEWNGFTEALEQLKAADGVVVDMRGNGGGDDSRGFELAELLTNAPAHTDQVRQHRLQSPQAYQMVLNLYAVMGDGHQPPDHLREQFDANLRAQQEVRTGQRPMWATEDLANHIPPGPNAYAQKVALLVDAGCASSCESTLEALRHAPLAQSFGQRTGGFIHFGDVGMVVLPHSRVVLHVPTTYNEYADGVIRDKVGLVPDHELAPGTDAVDTALVWMAEPQ